MAKKEVDLLIRRAGELLTLRGGSGKPVLGERIRDLGIIKDGALAVDEGKIVSAGKTSELEGKFKGRETIDAEHQVVMPGFIDPHTHLVFAGSREEEFEMRLQGASYMKILQKGGGILSTVARTRKANVNELVQSCKKTLDIMLEHGTTTVEAKSGYGLTLSDEVKCLKVTRRLNGKHPVNVVPTFLGAHAVLPEYEGKTDDYVTLVIDEMIPTVANHRLAEFCDVFCERGVFNLNQSKRILLSGIEHGLTPKLHADEMSQLGGAELAAEVEAVSAEHLLFASGEGLKIMAKKCVVAVLLPAAAFSLMMERYADARKMIRLGVPVALGTDFSPSCWVENQQLVIALACRQMKMTPAEAITAATINAAHAINRANIVGSLELNKKADIAILNISNHKLLGYRFGANLVDKVIKEGRLVVTDGKKV